MLAVAPAVELIRRQVAFVECPRRATAQSNFKKYRRIQQSGLLNPALARQLMALSAARFAIQVLMAGQTAEAIGVHIPLWHLAAAMPFVIIACVIVVTPGGLGVNELSYATTLASVWNAAECRRTVGPGQSGSGGIIVLRCRGVRRCFAGPHQDQACRQASRDYAGRLAMVKLTNTESKIRLAVALFVAEPSGASFAPDVTSTSRTTTQISSCTAVCPAGKSCRIRCLLQPSSAKRTPRSTPPIGLRGRNRVGPCGRFFVNSPHHAACVACGVMDRDVSCWKWDAAQVIFCMRCTVQVGRCGRLSTATGDLRTELGFDVRTGDLVTWPLAGRHLRCRCPLERTRAPGQPP